MKAKTGKRYFAIPSATDPMPTWQFLTWIWQQGGSFATVDLTFTAVHFLVG